ncbi:Arylesterase [Frankliniella fusca]|uniref:Arylesterase n=1 Tax=Frankliniella fusca TaxID=407009 RepID=A0AAE1LJ37_9NEOP|nr:Arylesterase [Frankliniella fusca]
MSEGSSQALPTLLGDSILRRLLKRNSSLFSELSWQTAISGQTSAQLHEVIVRLRASLRGRRVVILIGANDCVKGIPASRTRTNIHKCILLLKRLKCSISICEILPIPKLGKLASRINK